MKVSLEEVKYIANLSKLKFNDKECEKFACEFEEILESFNYLNDLDLEIKDAGNDVELKPIVRKDVVKKFESSRLFRNVKCMRDRYIEVPKIIE